MATKNRRRSGPQITDDGRLRWTCPLTKKQKTIRVGNLGKHAHGLLDKIQKILSCTRAGEEPDAELRKWARELPADLASRLAGAGLLSCEAHTPSGIGAFFDRFITVKSASASKGTVANYKVVRKDAVDHFGAIRAVQTINAGDALGFSAWLRNTRKLAENTARKRCSIMRAVFEYAHACELIVRNPFDDKNIPKTVMPAANKHRRYMTNEDALKVLAACPDLELATMFALGRWCGVRPGEIYKLTWQYIGFADCEKNGLLTIPSPKTESQGKDQRVCPLFPEVRRVLLALREKRKDASPTHPIITDYAGKTPQWATKKLKAVFESVNVKSFPRLWRNLRSTRATELIDAGFAEHLVNGWLGHTEGVAEANYRRANQSHFQMAAQFETADLKPRVILKLAA